jgi:hypothetical protein
MDGVGKSTRPLDELDDPLAEQESEPPSKRPTVPPTPSYEMLRDSCAPAAMADPAYEDLDALEDPGVPVDLATDEESAGPPVRDDDVPLVTLSEGELLWTSLDGESAAFLAAMKPHLTVRAIAGDAKMALGRAREIVRKLITRGIVRLA